MDHNLADHYMDQIRDEVNMYDCGLISERECLEQITKLCKERMEYMDGTSTCSPRACVDCKDDCSGAKR